jgi:uncharacterized membrane protein YkoI
MLRAYGHPFTSILPVNRLFIFDCYNSDDCDNSPVSDRRLAQRQITNREVISMQSIRKAAIGLVLIMALAFAVAASDKKSEQKQLAKEAKITLKEARATALKEAPGKIKEGELERENGQLIYSFDITTKEGIKEVQVDAITGKVLKVETETKEQEAQEKAAEHKAAGKKKEATKKP